MFYLGVHNKYLICVSKNIGTVNRILDEYSKTNEGYYYVEHMGGNYKTISQYYNPFELTVISEVSQDTKIPDCIVSDIGTKEFVKSIIDNNKDKFFFIYKLNGKIE
jgi:hypothetical protein